MRLEIGIVALFAICGGCASSQASKSSPPEIRIRVLDRETGESVPRAVVTVVEIDEKAARELRWLYSLPPTVDDWVTQFGHTLEASATGEVVVPAPAIVGVVGARSGDRWGPGPFFRTWALGEKSIGPPEIRVERDTSMTLRAVDASKRPVEGAVLTLDFRAPENSDESAWSGGQLWFGCSGADGSARVEHLQAIVERSRGLSDLAFTSRCLGEDGAGSPTPAVLEPGKTIDVEVGPHAAVTVATAPAAGRALPRDLEVFMDVFDEVGDAPLDITSPTANGLAVFHCVTLKGKLAFVARSWSEHRFGRRELATPLQDGDVIRVDLVLDHEASVVTGRLIDEDGGPIWNRDFSVTLAEGTEESDLGIRAEDDRTGPNGQFTVAIERLQALKSPAALRFELDLSDAEDREDQAVVETISIGGVPVFRSPTKRFGVVALPVDMKPGLQRVGGVVMRPRSAEEHVRHDHEDRQ